MASEWNLWVWLECIGVVGGGCCKEVQTVYIDILIIIITFPYSTCVSSFFCSSIPTYFFVHFKNVFSFLFMLFLCNIANIAQRTFKTIQKLRSREHGDIIISTRTYVDCACVSPETSTCEVLRDVSRKLQLTLCAIMAS